MMRAHGNPDAKRAAFAKLAFGTHVAAVQPDQLIHERQANSCSFMGTAARALYSPKALEHMRNLMFRNAGSRILHRQFRLIVRCRQADFNRSMKCELESIGEEVK